MTSEPFPPPCPPFPFSLHYLNGSFLRIYGSIRLPPSSRSKAATTIGNSQSRDLALFPFFSRGQILGPPFLSQPLKATGFRLFLFAVGSLFSPAFRGAPRMASPSPLVAFCLAVPFFSSPFATKERLRGFFFSPFLFFPFPLETKKEREGEGPRKKKRNC